MSKRENLEQRALTIVNEQGEDGILQSELWKALDADSRTGSRISRKLESKNLVNRIRELSKGRWTYRIFIKKPRIDVGVIMDIPCAICEDLFRCVSGGEYAPEHCRKMTEWLLLSPQRDDEEESATPSHDAGLGDPAPTSR
jgi:hypothetical protein